MLFILTILTPSILMLSYDYFLDIFSPYIGKTEKNSPVEEKGLSCYSTEIGEHKPNNQNFEQSKKGMEDFIQTILTDIATAKSIKFLDNIYHSKIKSLPQGSGKKVILGVLSAKRESFLRQYV